MIPVAAGTTERRHYPAMDGLRGLAILLVVFLHNFGFMNYFFFGWLGVDLFFVISGFLITDILMAELGKPNYLRNFYMRRVLRIFPVFYLALVVFLFILPALISGMEVDYYVKNQVWFWTYLQNWLFVFKPPYGDKILLHTWSLAVEEQFYLFWPLAILLLRRPKRLLVLAGSLLVIVALARYAIWLRHIQDLSYSSLYTFTRIDGICIGSMIALLLRVYPNFLKKYTTVIVLLMAAVNFAFYFVNHAKGFTLPYLAFAGYTTFAVLFGLLVYEAVMDQTKWIRWIFTARPLKFFGKISYGFYVYHWPVYILLFPWFSGMFLRTWHVSPTRADLAAAISVTCVAVIISYISFQFFEMPLLRLKRRYR